MNFSTIALSIVALIFAYYLYVTFFVNQDEFEIFKTRVANVAETFPRVYPPEVRASYAHSFWVLVNSMETTGSQERRNVISKTDGAETKEFEVYFDKYSNNLTVDTILKGAEGETSKLSCSVTNIPLQRWVHIALSLHNNAMDIYVDGKLVRTCVADKQVALIQQDAVLNVAKGGGFSGYINMMRYHKNALSPDEAYALYRKGPGSNAFNMNYNVRLSLMKDNSELKSYQF